MNSGHEKRMPEYRSVGVGAREDGQRRVRRFQCECGLFILQTVPSLSCVAGNGNGCFINSRFIISGNHWFASRAIFAWHATPAPQHVDTMMEAAFGAEAADERFAVFKKFLVLFGLPSGCSRVIRSIDPDSSAV